MLAFVQGDELRSCDVLLCQVDDWLGDLIRLFDGGKYSHAAVVDGTEVLQVTREGIVREPLKSSTLFLRCRFIDVFRFRSKNGTALGTRGYPIASLIARMQGFRAGDPYAYDSLLLLAILTATRRTPSAWLTPLTTLVLRNILESAAELVLRIRQEKRQPLTCSELVYRCFAEAKPAGKYRLVIRGADIPLMARHALLMTDCEPMDQDAQGRDDLALYKERFLRELGCSKDQTALPRSAAYPILSARHEAYANFVTPHDLETSPNLVKAGALVMPRTLPLLLPNSQEQS